MKTTTTTTALRLLAVLFIFCLFAPMAAGQDVPTTPTYWEGQIGNVDKIENDGGGKGESWDDAILIATAQELAYFAQKVNAGDAINYGSDSDHIGPGENKFEGYYFALSADIDLEEHYWKPIGTGSNSFNGNFDGQGHCVSGLKVNVNENSNVYAGLFGRAYLGTIQNLGVRLAKEGVRATCTDPKGGNPYAGGIAGYAQNIHNCYVVGEGSIEINSEGEGEGYGNAGGIVGSLIDSGSLTNCYATVDIKIENTGVRHAGGIVGQCNSNSTISCTYATGDIETETAGNLYYAGGICGYLNGSSTIKNCLALNGRITGGDNFSNRIVGSKEGGATLTTNYASPDIVVNDKTVSGGGDGDANGNPSITINNFQEKLQSKWDAWTFSSGGYLPQLKLKDREGNYTNWPKASPQPFIDAVASLPGSIANADGRDGSGWNKAILIANRAELAYFAQQVNSNKSIALGLGSPIEPDGKDKAGGFKGYYFALSADIDLEEHYWKPIGIINHPFNGNFDGQGYCVSGLKVNGERHAGLFGYAREGTLRNIGVCLAEEGILATSCAGGIAGAAANINNCYVVGDGMVKVLENYTNSTYAGGIVGCLFGSLSNCYATIEVRAEGASINYAGGIVGYGGAGSEVSYTYATGNVYYREANFNFASGGICGYLFSGRLFSNLAANGKIEGADLNIHRIVGKKEFDISIYSNYASSTIQVNGAPVTEGKADDLDGAPSFLSTFVDDLKEAGWSSEKGWEDFSSGIYLPQLMMLKQDDSGYEPWNKKTKHSQPQLEAKLYLPSRLHIVSSTGGTLTVTDDAGNPLSDGSAVMSGTQLKLAYNEEDNYRFSEYLSGSDKGSLNSYDNNSITMPDADLYLSATFTYQEPEPPYVPPTPIYYSVYLPQVEGASTDPGPGEYEVESWNTFRFYLTIDSAYSDSQPVVTTDRGETLEPRTSDGAYLVKYVRTDVEVFIDGLIQNPPPVANEAISTDALAPQIWTEGSMLCIRMPEALPSTPVSIYTTDGRLHASFASTPGLSRRQLPTGVYIVRVGDTACKVIIK